MRAQSTWRISGFTGFTVLFGVAVSLALFRLDRGWADTRIQAEFAKRAEDQTQALERSVAEGLLVLHSLRGLYTASHSVERDEFTAFLHDALVRYPQIRALEWLPRVPTEEREAFEQAARADGLKDFHFLESGPAGTCVAAGARPVYFPIYFTVPLASRGPLLGFDVWPSATRRAAIEQARDTGQAVATPLVPPLVPGAESRAEMGFSVYLPIYVNDRPTDTLEQRRENLQGVVSAVFRIEEVVRVALKESASSDVELALYDDAGREAQRVIFAGTRPCPAAATRDVPGWQSKVDVGGRFWTVVCRPTAEFLASQQQWQPWVVLAVGLLFTLLLTGYHYSTLRHTALVEQEVAHRTAQLTREIAERRAKETRLAMQHAVTRALAEASSLHEVGANVVRAVCAALGWELGALWTCDEDDLRLRCEEVWRRPESATAEFEKLSRQTHYSRGTGLPGRVWASGAPAWIPDVTRDGNFPRAEVAARAGLHGAFGIPIRAGQRILGVLEFFSAEILPPDTGLLDMMNAFGSQVGQYLERVQAEQALKESEERYRDLFENASDLIQSVAPDGRLIFVNRAWRDTLGYREEEVRALTLADLIHPDALEHFLHDFHRVMSGGKTDQIETVFVSRAGKSIPVEGTLDCKFLDGLPAYTRSIFRDMTERKRVERMKNEFISTVSHELRTPLTSIRGALGLMAGGAAGELPLASKTMVEIAHRNAERLTRLINDILDIERIESGRMKFSPRPQEIVPLVEQAVEANRPFAGQYRVPLVLATHRRDAQVNADGDRVVQVITNLLSNAVKYSPEQVPVTITVSDHNGAVRIAVSDRGPGIPAEFRSRIFQKFAQADSSDCRQKGGTGLGLSIAKALVEQMGGTISFEEGSECGTTFAFELPKWTAPEPAAAENELKVGSGEPRA